ncbi:MAG: hypothetical protein ACREH3_06495, partial [Geminicoccales bacterium]
SHLGRLRAGRRESIDSSGLHLDILRDLKRIHSHLCAVAYPLLDDAGQLHRSRLKRRVLEDGDPHLEPERHGAAQPDAGAAADAEAIDAAAPAGSRTS